MSKEQRKMDKSHGEMRTKLKTLKIELETKIADGEDEILVELEKVKLIAETANTQSQVSESLAGNTFGGVTEKREEKQTGSYSTVPSDAFKVRNQIQDMWKSLRLDIAHRNIHYIKQIFWN